MRVNGHHYQQRNSWQERFGFENLKLKISSRKNSLASKSNCG